MQPASRVFTNGGGYAGRAIFLDRDGVICQDRCDCVKSWDEFEFVPGVLQALARLARSDLRIIVATNQSGVNLGMVPAAVVEDIHHRMVRAIEEAGGRVDLVVYCPHRPDEGCGCRKPNPGMLLTAAREFRLDLGQSYLVGDAASDVRAGQDVGCQCYLVLTGRGRDELSSCRASRGRFRVAADLGMVVEHILPDNVQGLRYGLAMEHTELWTG